jgi:hypothetical protein
MPSWLLTTPRPESPIHHRARGLPETWHSCQARHLSGFAATGLVESVAGLQMGRM